MAGSLTSSNLSSALTATTVSEDGNYPSSLLTKLVGINVNISICGTNSSELWLMMSPLCSTRYHSMEVLIVVAIILSLITLWTIFGNLLVLLALCRYGTLRTMSNCLIGNLAISDLLLALTVLPISTGHDLLGYWVFGELTCTLWLCIDVLYCTASIWGLCTVAFDRYMATVYPVWYHDQRSVRKALGCIIFVWIFSVIISFAPFIGWRHMIPSFFTFNPYIQRYNCVLFTSSSYVLYSAMGSFVIPSILMTFMYIRIFVVLHNQSKGLKTNANHNPSLSSAKNARNGYPIIQLPSDETVNDDGRDQTTATLMSATDDGSNVFDEPEETGSKEDTNRLLKSPLLAQHELDSPAASREVEDRSNRQVPIKTSKLSLSSASQRSNSFAVPADAIRSKTSGRHLEVVDLDRRNSHNVTIKRSTSDTENINIYMQELRLTTECHRSKSANALTSEEEAARFHVRSSPRRSLPCNISAFHRNTRMTMSMKRRFELREQRATKRMLLIMICFCVCWMPFLFMYVLRSICDTCDMNHHFVAAIIWLGYANSSLNPILYTLFNDDFKSAFKKLIGFTKTNSKHRKLRKPR